MKPDGVDTAAMEPMEALNAGPAVEVAPVGEAQDQALPAMQAEVEPQQTEATNKTRKDKPVDSKDKTKAPAKTKTTTTGTKASTTSSRPTTGQSRLTNGAQKSQANGVTKKTTTAGLEKKTSTTAATKKQLALLLHPQPRPQPRWLRKSLWGRQDLPVLQPMAWKQQGQHSPSRKPRCTSQWSEV